MKGVPGSPRGKELNATGLELSSSASDVSISEEVATNRLLSSVKKTPRRTSRPSTSDSPAQTSSASRLVARQISYDVTTHDSLSSNNVGALAARENQKNLTESSAGRLKTERNAELSKKDAKKPKSKEKSERLSDVAMKAMGGKKGRDHSPHAILASTLSTKRKSTDVNMATKGAQRISDGGQSVAASLSNTASKMSENVSSNDDAREIHSIAAKGIQRASDPERKNTTAVDNAAFIKKMNARLGTTRCEENVTSFEDLAEEAAKDKDDDEVSDAGTYTIDEEDAAAIAAARKDIDTAFGVGESGSDSFAAAGVQRPVIEDEGGQVELWDEYTVGFFAVCMFA